MKHIHSKPFRFALVVALSAAWCSHAAESAGRVDFGKFLPPSDGRQFVEVNISSNLIAIAARLVEKVEPDAAKLLRGVQAVRVNVLGVTKENRADLEGRIQQVRTELDSHSWERVVTARQEQDDVCVYLKTKGEEVVQGLVVTVIKAGKEAVFINVAGDIRPEQLAELGEKLKLKELEEAGRQLKPPPGHRAGHPEREDQH